MDVLREICVMLMVSVWVQRGVSPCVRGNNVVETIAAARAANVDRSPVVIAMGSASQRPAVRLTVKAFNVVVTDAEAPVVSARRGKAVRMAECANRLGSACQIAWIKIAVPMDVVGSAGHVNPV